MDWWTMRCRAPGRLRWKSLATFPPHVPSPTSSTKLYSVRIKSQKVKTNRITGQPTATGQVPLIKERFLSKQTGPPLSVSLEMRLSFPRSGWQDFSSTTPCVFGVWGAFSTQPTTSKTSIGSCRRCAPNGSADRRLVPPSGRKSLLRHQLLHLGGRGRRTPSPGYGAATERCRRW